MSRQFETANSDTVGGSFVPAWAGARDEPALRRLLRETPMPGSIRVSLEREPDFFKASMGWQRHYTALAREASSGEPFAMCSRSVRSAFVNGRPASLGYLSQLRILPGRQPHKRTLLKMGFEWLARTRESFEAPFDLTTLVEGNDRAQRLLTAGLKGLPAYSHLARMLTFLIPAGSCRRTRGLSVRCGHPELGASILHCLERFGRRHQFAPQWDHSDFSGVAAAEPRAEEGRVQYSDFFVVASGGRVAACLALWDQRAFRQAVVRSYSPMLTRFRPLLNCFGAGLPERGSVLPMAWLSHLAVENDEPQTFIELVHAVRRRLRELRSDLRWLTLMLAEAHPLAPAARHLAAHTYASHLYAVHAPNTTLNLDGRVPHLEGALL